MRGERVRKTRGVVRERVQNVVDFNQLIQRGLAKAKAEGPRAKFYDEFKRKNITIDTKEKIWAELDLLDEMMAEKLCTAEQAVRIAKALKKRLANIEAR